VRIQEGPDGGIGIGAAEATAGVERVLRHRDLVGVDEIEGLRLNQALQQRAQRANLIAHHDDGLPAHPGDYPRAQVAQEGALHRDGVHGAAEGLQMRHSFRAVIRADEGDQRNLVLLRQVPQHIIRANLGTGIEWIGQYLGEEQNARHAAHTPFSSTITLTVRRRMRKSSRRLACLM